MNTDQKLRSDEFGSGFCRHVISCSFEKISGNHGWHGFSSAASPEPNFHSRMAGGPANLWLGREATRDNDIGNQTVERLPNEVCDVKVRFAGV